MNKTIKYKYAYDADQNNKLVSIDDVVEYGIRDHTFICLNCGNELIPAIGKKKTPHFKHITLNIGYKNETTRTNSPII